MTVRRKKLTPQGLLEAPRQSLPIPNATGTLAVYTQTSYSFQSHTESKEIRILDLAIGRSWCINTDPKVSSPQWLGRGDLLMWLEAKEDGTTNLTVADTSGDHTYVVYTVFGAVTNLKVTGGPPYGEDDDVLSFAVTGKANPDGSLFQPSKSSELYNSGRLYTSFPGRYGDSYRAPQQNAIWFGSLRRESGNPASLYTTKGITNLMKFFGLEGLESPIQPGDEGIHDFHILPEGIAFIAKDPEVDSATHTACSCYSCPILLWDWQRPEARSPYELTRYRGLGGDISSPVQDTKDGHLAFLSKKKDGYGCDKNRIIYVPFQMGRTHEIFESADGKGLWELSPSAISFAPGPSLLIQVEEKGYQALYQIKLILWPGPPTLADLKRVNTPLTSVTGARYVPSWPMGQLLISTSSFIQPDIYSIVNLDYAGDELHPILSSGPEFGLSKAQINEIWFDGANEYMVHAWVIRPSDFRSGRKYPLAYFVHEGPQNAWINQWSLGWNLALFAERGYVVVAPNLTGSTGYGQSFTDAIQNSWGGLPYIDLKRGLEHVKRYLGDEIDTNRAVALGTSYGGYLINWIQGHELGREFKALVTHNGIFSLTSQLASDQQYSLLHDLSGPPWVNPAEWQKWDPSQFIGNWKTPHLITHGKLDYRYPATQGLATFHVLQMKGIESAFLTFDDENRKVQKPENLLLWYNTVLDWIDKHTGLP